MQIFIKNLNNTRAIKVQKKDTIDSLMYQIKKIDGIEIQDQLLISSGKVLNKKSTFFNINEGDTINVFIKLVGGRFKPDFIQLVKKIYFSKKICRKCCVTIDINKRTCRKRKCGNSSKFRLKKMKNARGYCRVYF